MSQYYRFAIDKKIDDLIGKNLKIESFVLEKKKFGESIIIQATMMEGTYTQQITFITSSKIIMGLILKTGKAVKREEIIYLDDPIDVRLIKKRSKNNRWYIDYE